MGDKDGLLQAGDEGGEGEVNGFRLEGGEGWLFGDWFPGGQGGGFNVCCGLWGRDLHQGLGRVWLAGSHAASYQQGQNQADEQQ